MKKLLVTGGAGFIGSNFVHYIIENTDDISVINLDKLTYAGNLDNLTELEENPRHRFVKGDICDRELINDIVRDVDYIVNFAAETHVDRSIFDAGTFINTDVYGTFVLLEAVKKHKTKKFIQISTDEVYGEAFNDRPSLEDDPLYPKSPYAASKAGADRLAFSYFSTYGLPVIITRCSNNFGRYQYPEKLIPLFVTNAIEGKSMPVYGTGENTRDWIHVDDHCDAVLKILQESEHYGEAFNIGASTEKSIKDIAGIILDELEKPKELMVPVPDRLGHVKRHAVDTSKIKNMLGWEAVHDFEESLRKTIQWYRNNESWWRDIKMKSADYQIYYTRQYGEKLK